MEIMGISKDKAVMYIRSDIGALSEQSDGKEISAYVQRIRAAIGLLMHLDDLATDEASTLEDEMAKARKAAVERSNG